MNKVKTFFLVLGALLFSTPVSAKREAELQHVQPAFWWAGMAQPALQILLHGEGIGTDEVRLSTGEIPLTKVVRPDNPDYLLLYVDLQNVAPQRFDILLTRKGHTRRVPYEIKARENRRLSTFDASDVVYLFMPDRFANGNRENDNVKGMLEQGCDSRKPDARHGGDLAGIVQHLDYLHDLGVTALWPTPLLENNMPSHSYHGYGITDYYRIDPRYGTNEEYRDFVRQANGKGLKVIMDMVFNHCGSQNFLFADRPADDWFNYNSRYVQTSYKIGALTDVHAVEADRKLAQDGWFVEVMPDFNQRNPDVLTYLIQNSIWWIEYAGISGIRQDTYPYADFEAMATWCKAIDREYPGFNIVGETWVNHNVGISYWQKDSKLAAPKNSYLPTVMDFPLMSLLNYALDEETNDWDRGLARIQEYVSQDGVYADPMHLLTFLDNHDTQRFAAREEQTENLNRYRQALTLLLTLRGIPQIYYGDEIGMAADKSKGDGALRQNFPGGFGDEAVNGFTGEGLNANQKAHFDFARKLLNWRKGNVALAQGSLRHYTIRHGVYVYAREAEGRTVTVVMNGTNQEQQVDAADYAEVLPAAEAEEVISGRKTVIEPKWTLAPREIRIFDFKR